LLGRRHGDRPVPASLFGASGGPLGPGHSPVAGVPFLQGPSGVAHVDDVAGPGPVVEPPGIVRETFRQPCEVSVLS
jgi:hypothetical protein